ncbi:hypothetical protein Noda2021_06720 [Candidatus Dependentiae bacterium Noda2021]|nr:hypothetical protein Noda2021_06720 [Candidatus Dependentiae bacterium Noda2021]
MNSIVKILIIFTLHSAIFAEMVTNQGKIQSKNLIIQTDSFDADGGEYVASEMIKIDSKSHVRGNGLLKAPKIRIKTKKFEFAGTISCDVLCVIITEEPFNHKMFKQTGRGQFSFITEPMPDPVNLAIGGYEIILRDALEQSAAEFMKDDNVEAFSALINENSEFGIDKDQQRILLSLSCLFKAYKITKEICTFFPEIFKASGFLEDSPLLMAVSQGDLELVKILIDAGADVNERYFNHNNLTVLILAADRGYLEIVKVLLKAGADTSKTLLGSMVKAIDCARNKGFHQIVRYLGNPSLIEIDENDKTESNYSAITEEKNTVSSIADKKSTSLLPVYAWMAVVLTVGAYHWYPFFKDRIDVFIR